MLPQNQQHNVQKFSSEEKILEEEVSSLLRSHSLRLKKMGRYCYVVGVLFQLCFLTTALLSSSTWTTQAPSQPPPHHESPPQQRRRFSPPPLFSRTIPSSVRRRFGGSNFTYAPTYTPMNGRSLRVVAISDSHGFERGLHVPDGDVLVHCGDFAPASKVRAGMDSFGRWLSSLPHPYKIVVRGNHDPERIPALATYSDVLFVHRPATLNISGVRFAVAPYPVKGKVHKGLATSGSVLASHVPPYGVLDECVTGGKHIGDATLRRSVEGWAEKPRVWLCGHVHESFGAQECDFTVPMKKQQKKKKVTTATTTKKKYANDRARAGGRGGSGADSDSGPRGEAVGAAEAATATATTIAQVSTAPSGGTTLCLNVAAANDGRAVKLHEHRTARVFLIDTATKEVELVE